MSTPYDSFIGIFWRVYDQNNTNPLLRKCVSGPLRGVVNEFTKSRRDLLSGAVGLGFGPGEGAQRVPVGGILRPLDWLSDLGLAGVSPGQEGILGDTQKATRRGWLAVRKSNLLS